MYEFELINISAVDNSQAYLVFQRVTSDLLDHAYESCITDACNVENDVTARDKAICDAYEAFNTHFTGLGLTTTWRTKTGCGKRKKSTILNNKDIFKFENNFEFFHKKDSNVERMKLTAKELIV